MVRRILFLVNSPAFFVLHRLPLALSAKQEGYDVHVATMPGKETSHITAYGLTHHVLPLTRSGKNPLKEIFVFTAIYKLFRQLDPTIVHLVTIKPVLYGCLVARLTGTHSVVAAVSGLGFVFIAKGFRASLIQVGIMRLYRLAFGIKNLCVIFQNNDDLSSFIKTRALTKEKTVLIKGAGVDLVDYPPVIEPGDGIPVVLMAARLLRDKGVIEFVEAARLLYQEEIRARFLLVGDIDPDNPASMTDNELNLLRKEGHIELLGHRQDIPKLFTAANIIVLPSYREGLPKVLVEAAAAGRAVVTTDVPGCRDAIEPGISGLLVPVRDAKALAIAIQRLIEDSCLRQRMGQKGRQLAEREFSIEKIVCAHLDVYKTLEAKV